MKIDARTREVTLTEKEYKDLELTWEDIRLIIQINNEIVPKAGGTAEDYSKETLRRFNETRK